jgi:hypothetical protein
MCDVSLAVWPDHAPGFTQVVVARELDMHVEKWNGFPSSKKKNIFS